MVASELHPSPGTFHVLQASAYEARLAELGARSTNTARARERREREQDEVLAQYDAEMEQAADSATSALTQARMEHFWQLPWSGQRSSKLLSC